MSFLMYNRYKEYPVANRHATPAPPPPPVFPNALPILRRVVHVELATLQYYFLQCISPYMSPLARENIAYMLSVVMTSMQQVSQLCSDYSQEYVNLWNQYCQLQQRPPHQGATANGNNPEHVLAPRPESHHQAQLPGTVISKLKSEHEIYAKQAQQRIQFLEQQCDTLRADCDAKNHASRKQFDAVTQQLQDLQTKYQALQEDTRIRENLRIVELLHELELSKSQLEKVRQECQDLHMARSRDAQRSKEWQKECHDKNKKIAYLEQQLLKNQSSVPLLLSGGSNQSKKENRAPSPATLPDAAKQTKTTSKTTTTPSLTSSSRRNDWFDKPRLTNNNNNNMTR